METGSGRFESSLCLGCAPSTSAQLPSPTASEPLLRRLPVLPRRRRFAPSTCTRLEGLGSIPCSQCLGAQQKPLRSPLSLGGHRPKVSVLSKRLPLESSQWCAPENSGGAGAEWRRHRCCLHQTHTHCHYRQQLWRVSDIRLHTLGFNFHQVQERAKLVHGERSQKSGYRGWENSGWKWV